VCEAPRVDPRRLERRPRRTLAPRQGSQGSPPGGHREEPRAPGSARRLEARHRPGVRHRCHRDGDVVAARRAAGGRPHVGELRPGVGDRRHGAAPPRRTGAVRALRTAARPGQGRFRPRRGRHACLVLCDATSAVFAMDVDFSKLDVVTWSWQKVLGGEAAHGMLALSARAVARLESYVPPRPLPKIFRLTKRGRLDQSIFEGSTINTPSMLCVEDALDGLAWAEAIGGLPALIRRSEANLATVAAWVARTPWVDFLAKDAATRSCTSICFEIV